MAGPGYADGPDREHTQGHNVGSLPARTRWYRPGPGPWVSGPQPLAAGPGSDSHACPRQ